MNEDKFWEIISLFNWKKTGDDDAVLKLALKKLVSMDAEDIQQFEEILAEKLYYLDGIEYASNIGEDSYKGDDDYCSVDDFLYARCCVVANGKDYYYSVLENPTDMPKDIGFEAILYLADEAYNEKMNTEDEMLDTKYSYETLSIKKDGNRKIENQNPKTKIQNPKPNRFDHNGQHVRLGNDEKCVGYFK